MRNLKTAIGAIVLVFVAAPLAARAEGPFDAPFQRIVGFGDSLSDPGNIYALTGLQIFAPYSPIPPGPYAIGDNHFSNGPTWLEQMTEALRKPMSGEAAFVEGRPFSNYAAGGARARPAGLSPDLSTQVAAFLSHNRGQELGHSLFVIQFGGNDLRDALTALAAAGTADEINAALAIPGAAIQATASNIQALYAAGARRFLILGVPNLSMTPAIQSQGEPAISTAAFLSGGYNAGLYATLDALEASLPDIDLDRLDIASMLTHVAQNPGDYGLSNSVSPCLSFGVIAGAVCANPDEYLYWDALHPTTVVHGILAAAAAQLVGANLPPGLAVTE